MVIERGELARARPRYQRVIIDGKVMEWSSIGYVPVRAATEADYAALPRVE